MPGTLIQFQANGRAANGYLANRSLGFDKERPGGKKR
jgi:hypothetical protein